MIDYSRSRRAATASPGSYEVQGVYQEREGEAIRFYTYVVREQGGRR